MCERRRAPVGTTTAFSTLLGGSPGETMGRSASSAPVARSEVPATLVECLLGVLTGAGLNRAAPPAKTMSTSVARPSTIAAGFMLTARRGGGRGGAGGSVVVVDASSMTGEPRTEPGADSFAGITPAEVVDGPVAGAETPAGRPGQGP